MACMLINGYRIDSKYEAKKESFSAIMKVKYI